LIGWLKRFLGIGEKPPSIPQGAVRLRRSELVSAVPELHPDVERITDPRYGCLLEWKLSEEQMERPAHSWFPRLVFRAVRNRRHRLVLDDMGRRTVELIDGRRSIAKIAATLCEKTQYPDVTKMEDAVLAFVTHLVRRNAASLGKLPVRK